MLRNNLSEIGIISFFGKVTHGETFLANLLELQRPMVKEQHVIAPDLALNDQTNICFYPIEYNIGTNFVSQIWHQAKAQVQMSLTLIKLFRKVDSWIFFGGDVLLLPMLCAKLTNKKVLLLLGGNLESEVALKKNILNGPQKILRRMCLGLTDYITVYSHLLIKQWSLEQYTDKIIAADTHYLDSNVFKTSRPFNQRERNVGYIGRLSPEKGLTNLLQCLPIVLSKFNDLKFLIIGDGPLMDQVRSWIDKNDFGGRVVYYGRVPHERIADLLNNLRLCVLPSYTEGLPNIMLESMGCGTPVLATPVGAIPNIITDKENGFILPDNSPESIAHGIIRALESPDLSRVSELAQKTIVEKYNLSSARLRYQKVIEALQSTASK